MVIKTERLVLIPLEIEDLESLLHDEITVFSKYGFAGQHPEITEDEKKIYTTKLEHMKEDPNKQLYSTYFWMQRQETKEYIGEIGFKSFNESFFSLEVGYGSIASFHNKGYMTEALRALLSWVFDQSIEGLLYVIATTRKENIASIKVLEKVGFKIYSDNAQDLQWMIDRGLFEETLKES